MKKFYFVMLLLVITKFIFIPISIPIHKELSGVSYYNNDLATTESVQIKIDGTYKFRLLMNDEFNGYFSVSTEPVTSSDTVTVDMISERKFLMPTAGLFYYTNVGQGYLNVKNLRRGYFSPYFTSMVITNGMSVQEDQCHIIAAPANSREEAEKLLEKHDAF